MTRGDIVMDHCGPARCEIVYHWSMMMGHGQAKYEIVYHWSMMMGHGQARCEIVYHWSMMMGHGQARCEIMHHWSMMMVYCRQIGILMVLMSHNNFRMESDFSFLICVPEISSRQRKMTKTPHNCLWCY